MKNTYRVERENGRLVGEYDATSTTDAIEQATSEVHAAMCRMPAVVAYPARLAKMLINTFESWIGTPSEDLLEDGGLVRDHLEGGVLYYSDDDWAAAWDEFDRCTGRG